MTNDELKQAVMELQRVCSYREKCNGCPFKIRTAFAFGRCLFNPFGYVGAFPREWKVGDCNVDD